MGRALGTLLILGLGLAAGGQTINADTWRVRLADVADHKLLSVTDNSGVIEFRNEKTVAFTVPSSSIGDPSQHAANTPLHESPPLFREEVLREYAK